ncbi:hypothetical protein ABZ835_37610 [Streptomyces sp. NPDC047461]|uniref:hypothetical protein n=1 Tax=Streptomyces sp. NPDC047461 TaxID=3155619 RepID=UPI003408BFDC
MVAMPLHSGQSAKLHGHLTAIGRSWLTPLTTHLCEVQQSFASGVAAASRRVVEETFGARRAELVRLVDDLNQRQVPDLGPEMPLAVLLVVRFE